MKGTQQLIEELVEKLEGYGKNSLELAKLKTIRSTSGVVSQLAAKSIILLVMSMFILILNIGISLWIGKAVGEYYLGFLIVAGFYLFVSMLLAIFSPKLIQRPIRKYFIRQIFK